VPKQRGTRVEDRLYTRTQRKKGEKGQEDSKGQKGQSARRYYADFRDYADVGGGLEALTPEGTKRATTDKKTAMALARARLKALKKTRRHAKRIGNRKGLLGRRAR